MKNVIVAGIFSAFLAVSSCAGVKNAQNAQNVRKEVAQMKGDWVISNVDYDKSYKIKPFDEDADISCFVGSHWKLVPNNFSGSYALDGGGSCPAVTQPIKFDVTTDKYFKFKKLIPGSKAKSVTSGYELRVENQTADSFTLVQDVPYNGSVLRVAYNFERTAAPVGK